MILDVLNKHYSKIFIGLFFLFSALILFLDVKIAVLFGLTFEEEILFPAIGIMFIAFVLLVMNKKFVGKSYIFIEWNKMSIVSKFFGMLSFFLFIVIFILVIFQDVSLFNLTPLIITEEQIVAISMLLSILIFVYVHSNELISGK